MMLRAMLAATTLFCFSAHAQGQAMNASNGDPLPRGKAEEVGMSSERLGEIEKVIKADIEKGHLPGAVHIHFEEVQERAPELLPDKDALIVTYCSNTACQNSRIAAEKLAKLGYTNVRRYEEGKQDWDEAGLELEVMAL